MNSNLKKTLQCRSVKEECVICGRSFLGENIHTFPYLLLGHSELGPVRICEKHIKVQKE